MIADDSFSQYDSTLIDDTYDVVDRIVVSASFRLGSCGGGFR
jgi:hypothetical protein